MTTLISIVILAFGLTAFARGSATPNQRQGENPRVTTGDTTGTAGDQQNTQSGNTANDSNTSTDTNANQNQKKKGQRAKGTDQNKGSGQSY